MPDTTETDPHAVLWAAVDELRRKVEELRVSEAREGAVLDRLILMEPKIATLTEQVAKLHTKVAVNDVKLYALVILAASIISGLVSMAFRLLGT